jgi:hypothetical protein
MGVKRLIYGLLGLTLSMPALSQTPQAPPARFEGIVVDAHIARIPRASVLIEGPNHKWNLETDADGDHAGEVSVELPAGKYKFTVEARGFKKLVVGDFCVAAGAKIRYEFRLDVRDCDDCKGLYAPGVQPPAL